MKRFLSLFLAIVICASVFPMTVFAREYEVVEFYADPVYLCENTEGHWSRYYDENGEMQWWYHYSVSPERITVRLSNGEEYSGTLDDISNALGVHCYMINDQSYENRFTVGKNQFELCMNIDGEDVFGEFPVYIEESPVESIECTALDIWEHSNGSWQNWEDPETGAVYEKAWYNYYVNPYRIEATVRYKDGTVEYGTIGELMNNSYDLFLDSDQYYEHQLQLGTNQRFFCYKGFTTYVDVNINESIIEKLSIDKIEYVEYSNGSFENVYDYETGEYTGETWFQYHVSPEHITVEFKNGDYYSGDFYSFYWQYESIYDCSYSTYTGQSSENQWGIGTHQVELGIMGKECVFEVEIVEDPIARVEIEDIYCVENWDGYWSWQNDPETGEIYNKYWEYNVNPRNMTIFYKDGTQISGDVQFIREETGLTIGVSIFQNYENQYTVGDYTGNLSIEGVNYKYNIHVTESPIESFTAHDVELYHEVSGWWQWAWEEETQDYTDKYFWYEVDTTFDIVMKDGTKYEKITKEQISQIFGVEARVDDDQGTNRWGMGEHKVNVAILGASCEITVNIVPGGYITADRMQVIENWDGYEATSENGVKYWEYYTWPQNVTVKLNNGEIYTGTTEEIEQMIGGYFGVYVSQSPENTWGVGVHTVEFTYTANGGKETYHGSFEVEVVESPIESITASKLTHIVNSDGWYESQYDDETGNYIGDYYKYQVYPNVITVVMKNGVVYENIEPRELEMIFDRGLQINDDQSCSNQWGVGSHVAYGNFLGCEFEIPVEILATDVSYIRLISASQIPECSYVYSSEVEDENGRWYKYDFGSLRFEVGFVNGRIIEGTANELMWNYDYELNINSGETYENRLGIGLHTLEVSLRGKTEEIEIEIVDNGISHFEISDVTYTENQNTSTIVDGDKTWKAYDVYPESITIYLDNGESYTSSMYDVMERFDCRFIIETDQSYENQWGVGEHTAYLTFGNEKYPFKVTINEFFIERIEIEDVKLVEKWDGYYVTQHVYDQDGTVSTITWFRYYEEPETVTLYYKDGTVRTVSFMDLRLEFGYENCSYYFEDVQYDDNQWQTGGTYTGTFRFFGLETEYNLTIVETPVANVDIPEIELIEHWNGNWCEEYINGEYGYYFDYYIYVDECLGDELITVTMKDGTVIKGTYKEICAYYEDATYLEVDFIGQGYLNQCTVGKNKATIRYFGYEEEIEIEIKADPIERVEFEKLPSKSEYTDAESFNMLGATIKVTYKDGTVERFVCDEIWLNNNAEFYSEYLGGYFNFYRYDTINHGNNEYTMVFKERHTNATFEINYKVTKFLEKIDEYTGEDGFGYVRYTFTDGSTQDIKLDNVQVEYLYKYEQGTVYGGLYCISDNGVFPLIINIDGENTFTCGWYSSVNGNFIESAPMETPLWFAMLIEANETVGKLELIDKAINADGFNGEVTENNVDELILMAYFAHRMSYEVMHAFYEGKGKFVISAEEAKALLADYIGKDVDVSISKNYVAESDTVEIPIPENGDFYTPWTSKFMIAFDGESWSYEVDYKLYNGAHYTDAFLSLTFDSEGMIKNYNFGEVAETFEPGDVNEDGKVNVADLFALKVTILTGSADNSAADINGDGKLNINDLFILKQLIRG